MVTQLNVCILAAGIGSRMKSDKPKVLQTLSGRTFLDHLLTTVSEIPVADVHIVVGQGAEQVKSAFSHLPDIRWVMQEQQLGTGHAVQQAAPHFEDANRTLVLLGDGPLIKPETLKGLAEVDADLTILTVNMDDPFNYGRIVRDGDQVLKIVEEKDASDEVRAIKEINTGVMVANTPELKTWLAQLTDDNAQKEYLLTDIVEHANAAGFRVAAYQCADPLEVSGVNTFAQLAELERKLQTAKALELMNRGVQLLDPARVDIRGGLTTGRGVCIDVNVVFEGDITIGDNVFIGPNCFIKNSKIGAGSVIKANSVLEEASVGNDCSVGPFARLRPGAEMLDESAVGNFVEVKKTVLGRGSKASHLTYLGDATIGDGVNIGAGTITCNYDGVNKYQTHIGDGAFIGSNSSLVAPVTVGQGATVGAGSTITKPVAADVLAVGRGKQIAVTNWQRPEKNTE